MKITAGRKIGYVVDCSFTDANVEKIVWLAKDADVLFIETTFLDADSVLAKARRHLTARQAGTIARLAGAKRIVTLHHSPRYKAEDHRLSEEAQAAARTASELRNESSPWPKSWPRKQRC